MFADAAKFGDIVFLCTKGEFTVEIVKQGGNASVLSSYSLHYFSHLCALYQDTVSRIPASSESCCSYPKSRLALDESHVQ